MVFLTGEVVHIIEAFKKVHCYDFIVKPFKEKEIIEIINVFLNASLLSNSREGKYTFIDIDSNLSVKLYHNDIIYIEYEGRVCDIHTVHGVYKFKRTSLSKLIKILDDRKILQTHRSFAVNTDYVLEIEKTYEKTWNISLRGIEDKILLSYTFRQAFMGGIE